MPKYDYTGFFDFRPVCAYGAILNLIDGGRTMGKTTQAKRRAILRAVKRENFTYWVRRTEDETKTEKQEFLGLDLLEWVDKQGLPIDDIDVRGDFCRVKVANRWRPVVKFIPLSSARDERGGASRAWNELIFDEYRELPEKLNRYVGNEAEDLIDLVYSKARLYPFRAFCFGNKEAYYNPYTEYLQIPRLPFDFQGIRVYKGGTALHMQINDRPDAVKVNSTVGRLDAMLAGTRYGDFLAGKVARGGESTATAKKPKTAAPWLSVDFGQPFTIFFDGLAAYVQPGVDGSRRILVDKSRGKYKRTRVFTSDCRGLFSRLATAYKHARVFYCDAAVAEYATPVIKKIILP